MDFLEFIKGLEIRIVEHNSLVFSDYKFEYVKANKFIEQIEYKEISQYYFVDLNKNNINLFYGENSIDSFKKFQEKLLASSFFNYKNDLRWNIYLIFLFSDDYHSINELPIRALENDENYARKYFFTYTEVLRYFNNELFLKNVSNITEDSLQINPLSEWIDLLKSANLTAVLTHSFLSRGNKDVNEYIYSDIPCFNDEELVLSKNKGETTPELYKKKVPTRITQLNIGDFRNHCFKSNQAINPVLVNIFHGANGCGKTSILEAIEYGITNEIKRLKDFGESCSDFPIVEVECLTESGEPLKLKSNKSNDDNKSLDKIWYGTPITRGASKTFNLNFNHFNCFNAEAAYKFALDESSNKTDYSDKLSKLLYDDSLIEMEKSWVRYKDAFEDELDRIVKLQSDTKEKISIITKELDSSNTVKEYSGDILNEIIYDLRYNKEINNEVSTLKQFQIVSEVLDSLNPILLKLKDNIEILKIYKFLNIISYESSLKNTIETLTQQQVDLKAKKDLLNIQLNEAILANRDYKLKIWEYDKCILQCEETITDWNKYKNILDNQTQVKKFTDLKTKSDLLYQKKLLLDEINLKISNLGDLSSTDFSTLSDVDIAELHMKIDINDQEICNFDKLISEQQTNIDVFKQYKIKLDSIAQELLKIASDKNSCPLCGSKFNDYSSLTVAIKESCSSLSVSEGQLKKYEIRKLELENYNKKLREKLKNNDHIRKNVNRIVEIAESLNNSDYFEIDMDRTIQAIYYDIKKIIDTCPSICDDMNSVNKAIELLVSQGYCDENISKAKIFLIENELYNDYIKNNSSDSIRFHDYINSIIIKHENKKRNLQTKIDTNSNIVLTNTELLKSLDIDRIDHELKQCYIKERVISSIKEQISSLESYFDIMYDDDLKTWINTFNQASIKLNISIKELELIEDLKNKSEILKNLRRDEIDQQKYFRNCSKAVITLRKMRLLKDYSLYFVNNNIKRIEYFFKFIHSPREFSELKIIEGGIVATREKDKVEIKAHQMSTGQRVSFALAVMFSSFISANKAPKFLLLDEPVANMDDLHLLNLIDILRELALRGTQIIFTTANAEVAGIFRRKFSFFGHEFNYFNLTRENNGYANVKVMEFLPDKEEGIVLTSIS